MRQTPLLILAYNRPDKLVAMINRLRPLAPELLMVVVDGPKPGDAEDESKVKAVRDAVALIDWTTAVQTRFRPVNLGLRASIVDAVGWATAEYGQVAVIEEDVLPGPDFLPYIDHMLETYRDDERISHISGYNVVPASALSSPTAHNRLTVYPESIAWATWARAWKHYDDDLTWGRSASVRELRRIVGTRAGGLRWRQNFNDAATSRISTWAYRWIATMWSRGSLVLSPNHNLVTYDGFDEGTHTTTASSWTELPLYDGPREALFEPGAEVDPSGDAWVNRVVFRGTPLGVVRGFAVSLALAIRKARRARRQAATRR